MTEPTGTDATSSVRLTAPGPDPAPAFAALDPDRGTPPGPAAPAAPVEGIPPLVNATTTVNLDATVNPYPTGPYATAPPPAYGAGYGPVGYGGYGVPGQPAYPAYPVPKTNGLAIASMVVSIVGIALLACYGVGGLIGIVGAILGHVSRRQIRDRQEAGDAMALAGIIVGWISVGLAVAFVAVIVVLFVSLSRIAPDPSTGFEDGFSGSGFDAIGLVLASIS